jgi:S1-C subfamily serine protease
MPLVLGGLVALLAVGGIAAGVAYYLTRGDATAQVTPPPDPAAGSPERPSADEASRRGPFGRGPQTPDNGTPAGKTDATTAKPNRADDRGDNPFNRGARKAAPEPGPKEPVKPTPVEKTPTPPPPVVAKADRIDPATIARLKASTVYLEVDDGRGGGGSGTGFFTGDPGLVVTNAHVLGMKLPGSREPAKVSMFVESGQAKQRLFEGPKVKVLAVDHEKDLAVLQIVNERDLPPPLPVTPSAGLNELDTLVVFGFPGGRRLSERNGSTRPPEVSVTVSTVSAFRNDNFGNRNSIQVQGGINHGNSGGPVVDAAGSVVGVAVRVDVNHNGQLTTIGEAVPSEYVIGLLAGRTGKLELGQAYLAGDRVKVPVSVKCADPLGQLKAVGVGFWIGEKGGSPRPPGDKHLEQGGDVGYREVPLALSKGRSEAVGEIDFPAQADGRAYWVQPFHSNKLVAKRYAAGNPITLASPPVDRTPGDLRAKYALGSKRELTVTQTVQVTETSEGKTGQEVRTSRTITQALTAEEKVEKPKAATNYATLEYTLSSLSANLRRDGEDQELPKDIGEAVAGSKPTAVSVAVGRAGEPTAAVTTPSPPAGADAGKREDITRYGRQLAGVIRESLLKLAGRSVNAEEKWPVSRVHWLAVDPDDLLGDQPGGTRRRNRQVQEELIVTYLGRRDRNGRAELVLKVDGVLRPIDGAPEGSVSGTVKGSLVVEDQTGAIIDAEWARTFDMDASDGAARRRVTGTVETTVSRGK